MSDCWPQFTSWFWGAFCQLLGAEASLSSGFHPQSIGQTKRVNKDLEHTLCCLASSCPSSWSVHLLRVDFTHNTLWHSSLAISAFKCQYGYALPMFPDQEADVGVRSAEQTVKHCRLAWRRTYRAILSATAPFGSPPIPSWTVNLFGLFGGIVQLALGRQERPLPAGVFWGTLATRGRPQVNHTTNQA
ncbi:hypothetical protein P4O66_001148 [Electrophorus voltai]|uniref:Integrase catalytic domain-containing protein n=1 Tax=Electrophorus voltai TaxID=2609070 RepID=A0AAD8ZAN3_9TELE|nr:hypothetical protein P4O66_001148 [Electrophorus voltai]